jgi:hypothetical protein
MNDSAKAQTGDEMTDVFFGAPGLSVGLVFSDTGLPPVVMVIAMICAGLGTIFLTRHTFYLGVLSYAINFCVLLAGAIAANLLLKEVRLPIGYSIERPLIISVGGMLFASLLALLLMPRDRQSR